jgi:hypothetical protein
MKGAWHVAPMGRWEVHIKYSPEKLRVIGRPVERWKNIKMDLKKTDLEGMDWINVAQDRDNVWDVVKMIVNIQIPNM